jgi:hypothetical protein
VLVISPITTLSKAPPAIAGKTRRVAAAGTICFTKWSMRHAAAPIAALAQRGPTTKYPGTKRGGLIFTVLLVIAVVIAGDSHTFWLWAHRVRTAFALGLAILCIWYALRQG